MEFPFATIAANWVVNILCGILALDAALGVILLCDQVMFKKIDFLDEIKAGNMSAAVAFAAMLAFAAYIIGASVG